MSLVRKITIVLLLFALPGCATPGKTTIGKAKSLLGGNTPEVSATNPANAEAPAAVSVNETKAEVKVQSGAKVTFPVEIGTRVFDAVLELPELTLSKATRTTAATASAPRPPDTTVDLHKADLAERRPLLYVAIGCALAGLVVAVVLKHAAIGGMIAGLGGGGAFAAWKFAEVPGWIWGAGLVMAGIAWAFYTRGQWDANGNGIPDALETKPNPTQGASQP